MEHEYSKLIAPVEYIYKHRKHLVVDINGKCIQAPNRGIAKQVVETINDYEGYVK